MNDTIAIIGAGPAGLKAAISAADLGSETIVIEKRPEIGGTPYEANYAALTPERKETEALMEPILEKFRTHDHIELLTDAEVVDAAGSVGDFTLTVSRNGGNEQTTVDAGSVIIATGFDHFDPTNETQMYNYSQFEDVITLPDAEDMLSDGQFVRPSTGEAPETIGFIQCVGSRDRQIGNQWCSKVCCGVASKEATEIAELHPDATIMVFYIDIRTYGFWEDELYWEAQEEHNVRYVRGIASEITKQGDQVLVKGEDTTMGRPYEIPMDVVVLSTGMEPSTGTLQMAEVFDLPLEEHGYLETVGMPLETVETERDGVYVAGAAAGPQDLETTVSMAGSAAAKAVADIRAIPAKAATDGGQ